MGEAVGDPGEIRAGDLTRGPPVDQAQQHGSGLRAQEARACEGVPVRVC
jgi:hypothetical protein